MLALIGLIVSRLWVSLYPWTVPAFTSVESIFRRQQSKSCLVIYGWSWLVEDKDKETDTSCQLIRHILLKLMQSNASGLHLYTFVNVAVFSLLSLFNLSNFPLTERCSCKSTCSHFLPWDGQNNRNTCSLTTSWPEPSQQMEAVVKCRLTLISLLCWLCSFQCYWNAPPLPPSFRLHFISSDNFVQMCVFRTGMKFIEGIFWWVLANS